MEGLFEEWKKRDIHCGRLFISDGANDEKLWIESDFKVLFLLKEAYDSNKIDGTWHLPSLIQRKKATGRTFKPIGQWAYGIKKIRTNNNIEDFLDNGKEINDALMSSAIINIKKSQGKKSSNEKDLIKYVESDWDLIEKQINLLNPNIIVCGKTWHLIRKNLEHKEKVSDRVYKSGDLIFVDYWHPANRSSNIMNYYSLCALIYKAQKSGKL